MGLHYVLQFVLAVAMLARGVTMIRSRSRRTQDAADRALGDTPRPVHSAFPETNHRYDEPAAPATVSLEKRTTDPTG